MAPTRPQPTITSFIESSPNSRSGHSVAACGPAQLLAQRQPDRFHLRQPSLPDLRLGRDEIVGDAAEPHRSGLQVDDRVGGIGVAVARLADAPRVYQGGGRERNPVVGLWNLLALGREDARQVVCPKKQNRSPSLIRISSACS